MNKAFIRSIEAVMAIILFFSFYSIRIQSYKTETELSNPAKDINSLLVSLQKTGILDEYTNSHDLTGLSELILRHISPLTGFKLELSYFETITAKNRNNYQTQANISFLKFFPKNTNTQSIIMSDFDGNFLPTSIINNYYVIEISIPINDVLIDKTAMIENLRISVSESESINTSSMHLFLGTEKTTMKLESISYNSEPYDANVSIKFMVPYAQKDSIIKATLFYSSNTTGFIQDYPELSDEIIMEYYSSTPEKSNACEIIFTDTLKAFEQKNYNLYYELNTQASKNFFQIIANHSSIDVFYENNYYSASQNTRTFEATNAHTLKTGSIIGNKNCAITMKVWNYE